MIPSGAVLALAGAATAAAAAAAAPSDAPTATTEWETAYTATGAAEVAAAAATAKTRSPTSHVKGKVFDRYVSIWFENTNYEKAAAEPNFKWFADKGVTLSNFNAVTHPSMPNYMSAFCGDYMGLNHDDFIRVDYNVSTVADLLDTKGISWSMYQEDMPFSGYEGEEWLNQDDGSNDYVRKHNPAILFDRLTHYEDNLAVVKNLSMVDSSRSQFHKDLEAGELPQWMFVTPNMTSDAHDTDVNTAGSWLRNFLEPLLDDDSFMNNTLVLITFDENESYAERNRIFSVLLGDALPEDLIGTTDGSYYDHYSEIATVEANWDLPTLGRFDVGANVFDVVGRSTGDKIRAWSEEGDFEGHYFNLSYAGQFNEYGGNAEYPAPNLELDNSASGRKILGSIKETWKGSDHPSYYRDSVEIPDGMNPPEGYVPVEEDDDDE